MMSCRGVIKNGRVELEPGASFPEGTTVLVDAIRNEPQGTAGAVERTPESTNHEQWLAELDRLSEDISRAWKSPKSALEILAESRR